MAFGLKDGPWPSSRSIALVEKMKSFAADENISYSITHCDLFVNYELFWNRLTIAIEESSVFSDEEKRNINVNEKAFKNSYFVEYW